MRFWIGAQGADMGGEADGITAITAGEPDSPLAGGALADRGLAAAAPSPSWLAAHPAHDVVYAALEGAQQVAAYRRTGEATLEQFGDPVPAGDAVCHIAAAPDGSRLIASCWGDGRVVVVPLRSGGTLGTPTIAPAAIDPYSSAGAVPDWAGTGVDLGERRCEQDEIAAEIAAEHGSAAAELPSGFLVPGAADIDALLAGVEPEPGPDERLEAAAESAALALLADAQRGGAAESAPAAESTGERPSRAHTAVFLPDGRVATTDLGFDLVRIWRQGPAGLVPDHEIVLPFGTGPRHVVLHPSGHLHVITEFSCEVWTLAQGPDGRWRVRASVALGALAGDTAAELAAGHDRAFLYGGLRGSDTISVLRVAGEGDRLEPVALVESGIRLPRHHVLVRDALLVAGQASNEIASLPVDTRTGVPGAGRRRLETPSPQHILPAR